MEGDDASFREWFRSCRHLRLWMQIVLCLEMLGSGWSAGVVRWQFLRAIASWILRVSEQDLFDGKLQCFSYDSVLITSIETMDGAL